MDRDPDPFLSNVHVNGTRIAISMESGPLWDRDPVVLLLVNGV